jgi:glutathione S-transferase
MMTLFHSPGSRATTVMQLIEEMGLADWIDCREVTIPREDGSGARDPANPHPEGKVPVLVHDGQIITERGAIMLHLVTLFPDAPLGMAAGSADWARLASWLVWYQGVLEPVLILEAAGITHPYVTAGLRGHPEAAARIRAALDRGPWLMGESFSAADLLVQSPYAWFPDAMPDDPQIRDWVARGQTRPAVARVSRREGARLAA